MSNKGPSSVVRLQTSGYFARYERSSKGDHSIPCALALLLCHIVCVFFSSRLASSDFRLSHYGPLLSYGSATFVDLALFHLLTDRPYILLSKLKEFS